MWILAGIFGAGMQVAGGFIGAVDGEYEGEGGTLTAEWAQDSAKVTLCAGNACCIAGTLKRSGAVYQLIARSADGLGCGTVLAGKLVATVKPSALGNNRLAFTVHLRPIVKALKPFAGKYERR